jgi:hypothetical protein
MQQTGTTIEVFTSATIVSVSISCTTSARNLRKNPLVDQCTPVRIIQASADKIGWGWADQGTDNVCIHPGQCQAIPLPSV